MINDGRTKFLYDIEKNITTEQLELAIKRLWINHHFDFNMKISGESVVG